VDEMVVPIAALQSWARVASRARSVAVNKTMLLTNTSGACGFLRAIVPRYIAHWQPARKRQTHREETSQYLTTSAPEVLTAPYSEARSYVQTMAYATTPQLTLSEAMQGNANASKENSGDLITAVPKSGKRGTRAAYLTARLARDRPDIVEQMKAGKYTSVRAADRHQSGSRARRC
jgi:hypothetical protein